MRCRVRREKEREGFHAEVLEKSHKKGGKGEQKEGGDALKHCCHVEVEDGLMRGRRGQLKREACFPFVLPSVSFLSLYQ